MKHYTLLFTLLLAMASGLMAQNSMPAIVIHGGAGTMAPGTMSDSLEKVVRKAMQQALDEGYNVMRRGGSALQAVEAAITVLENEPAFNAGKGAVRNAEGRHELDASIMDGSTLDAGAVAGVTSVKNPIKAAMAVMQKSPHVMMAGEGADTFAKEQGLKPVKQDYYTTPAQKTKWDGQRRTEGMLAPTAAEAEKYGTVGAVAIDKDGNIAAGTSTGGMEGKRFGRIGDSPIIGAGTYADNKTCGVSCTGHGEYFIRIGVAKEISDQIAFGGKSLEDAVQYTLHQRLETLGGKGGLIAIDKAGNIVMEFNTPGMYRGYKHADGSRIDIYGGR